MRGKSRNLIYGCLILFFAICLGIFFIFDYIETKKRENELILISQEFSEQQELRVKEMEIDYSVDGYSEQDHRGISSIDIENGQAYGQVVIEPEAFAQSSFTSGYYGKPKMQLSLDLECKEDDIYILQFIGQSSEKCAKINLTIGDSVNELYLYTEACEYYIPITGCSSLSKISLVLDSEYQKIYITGMKLINYGSQYDITDLTTGMYYTNAVRTNALGLDSAVLDHATAAQADGKYIYSVYNGTLTIVSIEQVNIVGTLSGLGDTRDLAFTSSGEELIITSRRNGVYIVDVSDPSYPLVMSHYDTLEYATGLSVSGDYAFICSRWFGVEIVDISDRYNPQFITKISGEDEYQDCYVDGQYLYIGVYNGKRVDIWDVSRINNPNKIGEISLNGSGQGLCVKDGYLYVATALDAKHDVSTSEYACGTGNGMEIYNVSEPNRPKWVSTVKVEGRYNYNGRDVWDVDVAGGIAYLSNMYNGMYEIDVQNPYDPHIISNTQILVGKSQEQYHGYASGYLYPFDIVDSDCHGCVFRTLIANNTVYLVSPDMGLIQTELEAQSSFQSNTTYEYSFVEKEENMPKLRGHNISIFYTGEQVWAIEKAENCYIVACGDGGIQVLNKDLQIMAYHETATAVHDVAVFNDIVFTAETSGGLGIYALSDDYSLQEIGRFHATKYDDCFGSIQLTHDGKYIVVEASLQSYYVLDVTDLTNPVEMPEFENVDLGLMYYRSICNGLVDDKYIGVFGSSRYAWFYSDEGQFKMLLGHENDLYLRSNGSVALNELCLSTYRNGYVTFLPQTGELPEKTKIIGITFEGKLSLWDNILIISREYSGNLMLVNIQDINDPVLLAEFQLKGNPDLACADDTRVLIPCHHQGILVIEKTT